MSPLNIVPFFNTNKATAVTVIITAVVTLLFNRVVPACWRGACKLCSRIFERCGGRLAHLSFKGKYLNWLVNDLKDLKLTGLVVPEGGKYPQLEQVFISLRIEESRGAASIATMLDALIEALHRDGPSQASLKTLRRTLEVAPAHVRKETEERIIAELSPRRSVPWFGRAKRKSADEVLYELALGASNRPSNLGLHQLRLALSKGKHVAILGDPGAGKTTLLQYIALSAARRKASDKALRIKRKTRIDVSDGWRLPIFISLNTVGRSLQEKNKEGRLNSISDVIEMGLPPDLQKSSVAKTFFEKYLAKEKCILLLDGLDEVPTDSEFAAVTRAIESLAAAHPGNQIIVTSRIAGWRTGLRADFAQYFVNELDEDQINNFVDTWYRAVGLNSVGKAGKESQSEVIHRERTSAKQAESLKRELADTPRVRNLASNPMLLSIVALVHKSANSLPQERTKLYQECISILLEQWESSKGIKPAYHNLTLPQLETILRRIAFSMHTGVIGKEGGGRTASRLEIVDVIGRVLPNLGRKADQASGILQQFVSRSGLLVERQRNELSFSHLTFQEYFTAQHLAIGDGSREGLAFLFAENRVTSDWWREVVLLYAGMVRDASDLIRRLSERKTSPAIRQELRVAIQCLAEATQVKNAAIRRAISEDALALLLVGRVPKIVDELPHEVVSLLARHSRGSEWEVNALLYALSNGAVAFSPEVVVSVGYFLKDERSVELVKGLRVVEALADRAFDRSIINRIEELALKGIPEISNRAVRCLLKMNGVTHNQLVMMYRNSSQSSHIIQGVIIRAAGKQRDLYEALDQEIAGALGSSRWEVRLEAAVAVGNNGDLANNSQLDAFFRLLHDPDPDVASAALRVLPTLLRGDARASVIERVLALLSNDKDELRMIAVDALAETKPDSTTLNRIASAMGRVCLEDPSIHVRGVAFRSLRRLSMSCGCSTDQILDCIGFRGGFAEAVRLSESGSKDERRKAWFSLSLFPTELSLLALVKKGCQDRDRLVRCMALTCLMAFGYDADADKRSVLKQALNDTDQLTFLHALELSATMNDCSKKLLTSILERVASGQMTFLDMLRFSFSRQNSRFQMRPGMLQRAITSASYEILGSNRLTEDAEEFLRQRLNSAIADSAPHMHARLFMVAASGIPKIETLRQLFEFIASGCVVYLDGSFGWIFEDFSRSDLEERFMEESFAPLLRLAKQLPTKQIIDCLREQSQSPLSSSRYYALRLARCLGDYVLTSLANENTQALRDSSELVEKVAWKNFLFYHTPPDQRPAELLQ